MKKNTLLASLLLLFSLFFQTQCTSNDKALHKKLSEMALNLNASTPVMLDPYTRFDGASVTKDNVFQYTYSILNTENAENMVNSAIESMLPEMKKMFSQNEDLRIFKENKVTIEYVYKDADGKVIRSEKIMPKDYL